MRPKSTRERLAFELRQQIVDGAYSDGRQLPGIKAFASERGVSSSTVHRAYELLREWGLLDGEAGERPHVLGMAVIAGGELGRRTHPVTGRVVVYVACAPADPAGQPGVVAPGELMEVLWLSPIELGERMPDLYEPVREHLGIGQRR